MVKRSFAISVIISIALLTSAQVPQKFNFQAVVRDAQHSLIKNQDVGFKMSILEGSANGTPVYVETHTVTTNQVGVADLIIGDGSSVSGTFKDISWGDHSHFLKVEADPAGGTSYDNLGTTQLISVPYALYSANISSPTKRLSIKEDSDHPVDSALFEVRNAEGQTVFAVYPEGTRIFVLDEKNKGLKGGFAVGGYSRTSKGLTHEYLRVTPDSIRLYIDTAATKGLKGGFAVGGYSRTSKGNISEAFGSPGVSEEVSSFAFGDQPFALGMGPGGDVRIGNIPPHEGSHLAIGDNKSLGALIKARRKGAVVIATDENSKSGNTIGVEAIVNSPDGAAGLFRNTNKGTNCALGEIWSGGYFSNGDNVECWGTYTNGSTYTNGTSIITGDCEISGTLQKGAGGFKIDHPLDPENKYLNHSFVESPEMKNIYDGVVILDNKGEAVVILPEWFEALNKDFRYQLTCIGGFANVYIAEKVQDNQFKINGGFPGLEVSWQVTGIRKDAYANENRIEVEVLKNDNDAGKYLHPDAFGISKTLGIGFEEHQRTVRKSFIP